MRHPFSCVDQSGGSVLPSHTPFATSSGQTRLEYTELSADCVGFVHVVLFAPRATDDDMQGI